MVWKGIKHVDVGEGLDSVEFHDEELHSLAQGTDLPPTDNNEGDLFYKTDEHRLYIYISD